MLSHSRLFFALPCFIGLLVACFSALPVQAELEEVHISVPCILVPGIIEFTKTTTSISCIQDQIIAEIEADRPINMAPGGELDGFKTATKMTILKALINIDDLQPGQCFQEGNRLVCNLGEFPPEAQNQPLTIRHALVPLEPGDVAFIARFWGKSSGRDSAIISPIAKATVLPVAKRLVYPWVSNNAGQFESRVIANNFGPEVAVVALKAFRRDGQTETITRTIPAWGALRENASQLFLGLGSGSGYCVILESTTHHLSGHWVTNNLVTGSGYSPSQGVAVDITDVFTPQTQRFGRDIGFGYLPTTDGLTSAPVVINLDPTPADVTLRFYDALGNLVLEDRTRLQGLETLRPFATVINDLVPAGSGDLRMVASSENRLTGIAFVFNSLGEPAIGNVKSLRQTLPEGASSLTANR